MKSDHPSVLARLGSIPRRTAAFVVAGLAVLSMVVAAVGWGAAEARDDDLTGRPVSKEHLTTIQSAARSCPTLTPARLAGQLMAESGLDGRADRTASGGQGIAGLDAAAWKAWAPWPGAERSDPAANILALAHLMCDLSGQVRLADVPGDTWRLSLAAFHTGLDEVRDAEGVPTDAVRYVDQASGYAAYYGKLTAFGGSGQPRPSTGVQQPKAVPGSYTALVVRAGSVCAEVTPPLVAAQLMALSGFDANLLGPEGQRGVAQFRPEVWQAYGPSDASAWDPQEAIPAAGTALCALHKELSGLEGDPSLLALAAYRNGPAAVRQAGGDLDAGTQAYLRTVREHTDYYALDNRLRPAPPSASPSPSP
ncbi:transglycosylase SLT domain-containing protein, partial [Micromonospora wenchangensis]|uniref:transglycosylase SLT domain-containing protein n=1 Tax=Micromonospora wenchangensis TaxID=1185415 RepID=UPI0034263B80